MGKCFSIREFSGRGIFRGGRCAKPSLFGETSSKKLTTIYFSSTLAKLICDQTPLQSENLPRLLPRARLSKLEFFSETSIQKFNALNKFLNITTMSTKQDSSSYYTSRAMIDGIYIPSGLLVFGTLIVKREWAPYAVLLALALAGYKLWSSSKYSMIPPHIPAIPHE